MPNIAIIPRDVDVPASELALVASAINLQVNRDLAKAWASSMAIEASVAAFPDDQEPLSRGFVCVYVVADTGGADGVHRHPDSGAVTALVRHAAGMRWSLAASHEILELLVDPDLNTFCPGALQGQPDVTVQYLREICDPCEGADYAYVADAAHGLYVSDFCLPSYYANPAVPGPYSFQDNIAAPGSIVSGGRVTWRDAAGRYFQRTSVGGPERVVGNLSADDIFGDSADRSNIRGAVDRHPWERPQRRRLRPLAPRRAGGRAGSKAAKQASKERDRWLRRLTGDPP